MTEPTLDILGAIKAHTRYEAYDGTEFDSFEECEKYSVRLRLIERMDEILEMYLVNTAAHVREALTKHMLEDLEISQLMAINFKYMLQEKSLQELVEGTHPEETQKP